MELAVLSDSLRQRVIQLEHDHKQEEIVLRQEPASSDRMFTVAFTSNETLKSQHVIDSEIAGLEAELADDCEILDIAAQQGGIGVAEAISRNKRLKMRLREYEREIDACKSKLSASDRVVQIHLKTHLLIYDLIPGQA